MSSRYSDKYEGEIGIAQAMFEQRLTEVSPIVMTWLQFSAGTDSLDGDLREVVHRVVEERKASGYELSYSQVNRAFFGALESLNKLTLIGPHAEPEARR